jgi:large subunit ribosomal protein L11
MSKAQKITSRFRLIVPAGKASPQPPVGSALGQRGLKLMDFCKAFNDQTAIYREGTPIQVTVKSYSDRTFEFSTFTPPTTYFLLKAAGLEKGASRPGHETIGHVTVQQVFEIAQVKMQDLVKKNKDISLRTLARGIVGSARSMGIEVYNPSEAKTGSTAASAAVTHDG